MNLSIAAVGDITDIRCWSGTPYYFWSAASSADFTTNPWRVDLTKIGWQRWAWNAGQLVQGRRGGFQYSDWFLGLIESQIPELQWSGEILSFNQHFPRASTVSEKGGILSHYLDAPFAALATGRGLDLNLSRHVVEKALALERENYSSSQRIVTMGRWAARVVHEECGVPAEKIHVILPGANLDLPGNWDFPVPEGRPGKDRPFTLGFIGKDWKRKGLPLVVFVKDELIRRGWKTRILAAGDAPADLQRSNGMEFSGYINKHLEPLRFLQFLSDCDIGCLFSEREALGISTLEFLRAGVPVAGFAHEGPADTLPPDAGFRFLPSASPTDIADRFEGYLRDEAAQESIRRAARAWSPRVTWERCLAEFQELWETDRVAHPVQPWRGHGASESTAGSA